MTPAWVGKYRLDFTEELRAWYRAKIGASVNDPSALEAAMLEAEAEAATAEIEIAADGTIASRAGGTEFYRVPLSIVGERAHFEKPPSTPIELERSADGILAHEMGKPTMRFVLIP
jgi:hypothetical protein